MTTYRWRGVGSGSVEHLDVDLRDGGWRARSLVDLGPERLEYAMELSEAWVFRALRLHSSAGRELDLARDDDGVWRVDGVARPDLGAAVDVDLSFSPFTNTLPVRRLDLAVGAAADIVTAYVDGETLTVSPDPQRYTRLDAGRYLYESRDSDFRREVTVDGDGFVVDYPELFSRLPGA
ncbi:putative glycolipid-binding domain-containing protein [Isoptericola sp. NEAU-Y5]|uniref:Glycolipid-binding domain-containing protein n=1 Tax=Isoptericola luteus TaxID=2879484 RepID=A0ABS7ZEE5_9MICO|nr:putative glycolipid-binding domain-containing protein [Isoptericola sp. NEAU-Y5]MCA5893402.1 putative glycolipid-binding domain-containing protein [Isoptericola sp. NEAU-Y5]